jgi:hypothetical protein
VSISNQGTVSISLSGGSSSGMLVDEKFSTSILQGLNETNHYRILVKDSIFIVYANGQEVARVEDGNNSSSGEIQFTWQSNQNNNQGAVEIDNMVIQEVP